MQSIPTGIEFGALPRVSKFGDGTFPKYQNRFYLIPRDHWQPVSLNRHVRIVYAQKNGMCTANGAEGVVMAERSVRHRPFNPILSPEHLYGQVSDWGEGASLDKILKTLVETGCCTREQVPAEDGHVRRSWPEDWVALSEANRVLEWVDLNADFDAVATALQRRKPCLIGVRWPSGGGHAVMATQLIGHKGTWALRGPNSWGEAWGEKPEYTDAEFAWLKIRNRRPFTGGWWTLTERQCRDFSTFGCWAIGTSV